MADVTLPGVLKSGLHSARPAASAVAKGALFAETDTKQVYQSDGSSWSAWGSTGGSVSPLTTKGDLWVYGSADDRLAAGTDGYGLVADSAQAKGLKYMDFRTAAIPFLIDGGGSAIADRQSRATSTSPFALHDHRGWSPARGPVGLDRGERLEGRRTRTSRPTVADKITASAPPTISSATKSQDAR
jgi:hypothetical protein